MLKFIRELAHPVLNNCCRETKRGPTAMPFGYGFPRGWSVGPRRPVPMIYDVARNVGVAKISIFR